MRDDVMRGARDAVAAMLADQAIRDPVRSGVLAFVDRRLATGARAVRLEMVDRPEKRWQLRWVEADGRKLAVWAPFLGALMVALEKYEATQRGSA